MKITITRQFQQFLKEIGLPLGDLLERAEIPNLLWKEELKLTTDQYYRLLKTFDEIITDRQLLQFSQIDNLQTFMPPFFAALCSANGMDAIKRMQKYKGLVGPVKIKLTETQQVLSVHYEFADSQRALPRFAIINEQLLLISILRKGTGKRVIPREIAAPFNYGDLLTQYIENKIQNGNENRIEFYKSDLALPFLTQNNSMLQYLEPEMQRRIKESEDRSNRGIVRQLLLKAIPSGQYNINEIAHQMGQSVRSLQRNLKKEATTYNREVKDIQLNLAKKYLSDKRLTMVDIAYLVGYDDPSSFLRAFKRWTGMTTSEYRKVNC
ncbi:AraC family transcriptional regulator [Ligilactobacillus aviarius]|uniref:AraC family transcriptional regulator n=1 Tax=Ligilactobacillus aviarius TaxID=1606 RepID=UPI00255BC26A|nr:AraC family transcriptional regulator [Ligilactobacillus aviarius]